MSQFSDAPSSPGMNLDEQEEMAAISMELSPTLVALSAAPAASSPSHSHIASPSRIALPQQIPSSSLDRASRSKPAANLSDSAREDYLAPLNDLSSHAISSSSNTSNAVSSWNYSGFGVSLPRYASTAGLSSLSPSFATTPAAAPPSLKRMPSIELYERAHQTGMHGTLEYSPVLDRSSLIGLGELATPRFERRWAGSSRRSMEGEHELVYEEGLLDPDMMSQQRPFAAARQLSMSSIGSSSSPVFLPSTLFPNSSPSSFPRSSSFHEFSLETTGTTSGSISPTYSLHAVSINTEEDGDGSGGEKIQATFESHRASHSAPGPTLLSRTVDEDVTHQSPLASVQELPLASSVVIGESPAVRKRGSNASISTTTTTSRRSSIGRSSSTEGRTHHRRQSASKSGFAHLPPSPATNILPRQVSQTELVNTIAPSRAMISSSSSSSIIASTYHSSSMTNAASRTPEQKRHPAKSISTAQSSNHSSPSAIAASILRQSRDVDSEGGSASQDISTSQALRKLDGYGSITSPRLSRGVIESPSLPRATVVAGNMFARPPVLEDDALRDTSNRITALIDASAKARLADSFDPLKEVKDLHTSSYPSPLLDSPIRDSPQLRSSPAIRSASRPSSSTSDIAFPPSSPSKRGSSFSTTAGTTATSITGSRDSTSVTSMSGSASSITSAVRNGGMGKVRRGSASSDVSSVVSSSDAAFSTRNAEQRSDSRSETEAAHFIPPPVPPIPKDYESYRSSTATSASFVISSPRPSDIRRPSESSYAESELRSPAVSSEEESGSTKGGAEGAITTLASGATGSSGKTPPRKWSLSAAFGKSRSKSSSIPAPIAASASYSDLSLLSPAASSSRPRVISMHSHLSDRRMAASMNDIARLAAVSPTKTYSPLSSGPSTLSSVVNRGRLVGHDRASSVSSSNGTSSTVVVAPAGLVTPRRTPSGIPFFSRKSSGSSSAIVAAPTPVAVPVHRAEKLTTTAAVPEARKSILGLSFLRSTSARRDKEKDKAAATPAVAKRSIADAVSFKPERLTGVETGESRREELNAPPVSSKLMTKKTLQRSATGSVPTRNDYFPASSSSSSLSSRSLPFPGKPAYTPRATARPDTLKANLPTIAGSPSKTAQRSHDSIDVEEEDAERAPTPTKIPRFLPRYIAPLLSPSSSSSNLVHSASGTAIAPARSRRVSYLGSSTSTSTINAVEANESGAGGGTMATSRDPSLALGERTLSTRRRLEAGGELSSSSSPVSSSYLPRTRSMALLSTSTNGNSSARSREVSGDSEVNVTGSASSSRVALRRSTRDSSVALNDAHPHTIPTPRSLASAPIKSAPSSSTRISASATSTDLLEYSSSRRVLTKPSDGYSATHARRTSILPVAPPQPVDYIPSVLKTSRSMATGISRIIAPPSRVPRSNGLPAGAAHAEVSSSRPTSSTSSHIIVNEEELRGDEEMSAYVRRQQTKKLAAGMSSELIRKMFEFPDPIIPQPVLNTRDALSLYSRSLTEYEKEEILDHSKIYYVGAKCKKAPASRDQPANNFGYDDERGDYLLIPRDHILYRYEVVDLLGKGSFGQVLQCRDHCTGEMVAIKIIRNKKRFHHQALVEIKVLENLVRWDPEAKHSVIRMIDSFTFRGHLCIVTELLSINLYELIKANSFVGFSTALIRRFTLQILASLSLLRHHRVVHCDLKPENILLKHPAKSTIKVIDFGSSCFEHEKVYTYIQSRFYRSPEIILGMNYHMAIDMWSLGCILAEMFTGFPIFPGENEQEQLACIMEVLGVPEKHLIEKSSRRKLFFDSTGAPRPVVNSKGRRRRPSSKTLAQILKSDDDLFVDFISKCLAWDPDRRMKPDPATRHPWILAGRSRQSTAPVVPPRIGLSRSATTASLVGSQSALRSSTHGNGGGLAPSAGAPSTTAFPSSSSAMLSSRKRIVPPTFGSLDEFSSTSTPASSATTSIFTTSNGQQPASLIGQLQRSRTESMLTLTSKAGRSLPVGSRYSLAKS